MNQNAPRILLLVVLCGVLLRVPGAFTPLWLDEIWSLVRVHELGGVGAVFTDFRHSNNHHLLSLWFLVVGQDQPFFWYRLPSLLAGCASIWLAWRAGCRGSTTEGLFAALLTATCYPLVHYASEGRGYALAAFFALATFLAAARWADGDRAGARRLLALFAGLGLLSQALYLHALVGAGAWLVFELARRGELDPRGLARLAAGLAVPLLVAAGYYLLHLRGMTLGAGVPTAPGEATAEALAWAAGVAPASPVAGVAALLWVLCAVASLYALARSRPGEAAFHVTAILLSPVLVLAWTRPDVLPPRWFVVPIAIAQLPLAHGLAVLWERGGGARTAAGLLAAFAVLLHGGQLLRFIETGRGGYPEALARLAAETVGTPIEIGSDHDFRNRLLLDYYARALPEDRELEYVPRVRLPRGWPEWMIGHAYGAPATAVPAIEDPNGRTYALVGSWPASELSGLQWFLYRRTGDAAAKPTRPERPDVLLITVDTLRADHVGAYGYPYPTTPNIDRLAAEGTLFEVAYAPTGATCPAHATLFTSRMPLGHGVVRNGLRLADDHVTLAEQLRDAGWATAGFVSSYPLKTRFGLAQGFEHYDDAFTRSGATFHQERWEGRPIEGSFDRRGDATTTAALAWLESFAGEEPLFVWVHYFDPHAPFDPPPEHAAPFARGATHPHERDVELYDGEVHFADAEVGRLLEGFARLQRDRESIVVLTSDHGEGLWDHGWRVHNRFLYDEEVRVPLVWRWPGRIPAGHRVDAPVHLADVAPTLRSLLGLPELRGADGIDLSPALGGETLEADRPLLLQRPYYPGGRRKLGERGRGFGLRAGPWKYIERRAEGARELYRLDRDPRETTNLAERDPARADALSEELARVVSDVLADGGAAAEAPELDAQDREALRALGYLE